MGANRSPPSAALPSSQASAYRKHEFSLSGAEDGQYAPPTPRGLRGGFNPLALGSSVAEVAVFCPNCGTQNPDTALTCSKCNFNLKGASAPKFKGTMMMQSTPSGAPGALPPAAGSPPVAGPPSAALPPRPAGPPSKLKGTMVGVAPPMPGSAPKPPEAPPSAQMGTAGTQMMGAFPPPPRPPSAPPPAPAPAPDAQFGAFAPPASQPVNPLGGTMVASDASAFGGPPPGAGHFGTPPPQPSPFGGAPPPADPGQGFKLF